MDWKRWVSRLDALMEGMEKFLWLYPMPVCLCDRIRIASSVPCQGRRVAHEGRLCTGQLGLP